MPNLGSITLKRSPLKEIITNVSMAFLSYSYKDEQPQSHLYVWCSLFLRPEEVEAHNMFGYPLGVKWFERHRASTVSRDNIIFRTPV